jgi:hypothetical protein
MSRNKTGFEKTKFPCLRNGGKRKQSQPYVVEDRGQQNFGRLCRLPRFKDGPRTRQHVAEHWLLPSELRVGAEERFRQKITTARVSPSRYETHLLRHIRISHFASHRPAGGERVPVKNPHTFRIEISVATKRSSVRCGFLQVSVIVVGEEVLALGDVNTAFPLLHELMPSDTARIGRL